MITLSYLTTIVGGIFVIFAILGFAAKRAIRNIVKESEKRYE